MKKNILFVLHRLYFDGKTKEGGIDFFIRFFRQKEFGLYLIEHPLEELGYHSRLIVDDKIQREFTLHQKPPLRWLKELMLNKKILKQLNVKFEYAYASDPLNFMTLYWAKKHKMVKKIFFHCTDFSKNRFKNPVFNFIYQQIFKFSLKHADMTNVVTKYVFDMAKSFEPSAKINLIPNSPIFKDSPKIGPAKKNKKQLGITISQMTQRSNFDRYLKIIRLVKKQIPDIRFKIIGSADDYVKKEIIKHKMEKNIEITGLVSHSDAAREISKLYIGIVFYPKEIDHVKYGDSIKIREYAASGVPSVSDNITLTSKEMLDWKAGLTADDPQGMADNICKLISDKKLYDEMSNNALKWAKEMDKKKILDKIFS